MSNPTIRRITTAIVISISIVLSLFASTATAQTAMNKPNSQVQDRGDPGVINTRPSSGQFGVTAACGWNSPIYRHCGGNQFVLIRVDFAWSWDTADIWVTWGQTDLVWRYKRQIDNAWCIQNCG